MNLKKSHIVLLILMFTFLLSGSIDAYYSVVKGVTNITYLIHGFLIAISCFAWCHYHSRENGHFNRDNLAFWSFFCPPIGIPLYSFKIYGLKRGSKIVLLSLVFYISAASVYFIAERMMAKLFLQ